MEIKEYKKILLKDIVGIYGITIEDFLSQFECYKSKDLKVSYVDSSNFDFCTTTFNSEVKLKISNGTIKKGYEKEKLVEYCKEFNFTGDFFNRKIVTLSSSEKYLLYIVLNMLFDSDVYVFNGIFRYLDKINNKKIFETLKKLKKLGKTIIIIDDINILYTITNEIFIFKDNKIIFNGKTKEVLTEVEKLIKNEIEVPELPLITYLAKKKKGVKLFYHDDVRDIIKDVYKHV